MIVSLTQNKIWGFKMTNHFVISTIIFLTVTATILKMTVSNKIPIWVDCDPGQDDVMAIALAASNPHFNLIAVSSVHGNTSQVNATSNALRFLSAIGRTDVPVFPGAKSAINGSTNYVPGIHGKTGLSGSSLLPNATFEARSIGDFFPYLHKQIKKYKGKLCIAAVGPLTNISLFFKQYPDARKQIRFLSIMGGGFERFNIGKSEFNIVSDTIAADGVLNDPELSDRILLVPLDITMKTTGTLERRKRVLNAANIESATNFRAMMYELIQYYNERSKSKIERLYPEIEYLGPAVHDPTAVSALLYYTGAVPGLEFKSVKVGVRVDEKTGEFTVKYNDENGLNFLQDLNVDKFWDLLIDAYDRIDINAPMNRLDRNDLIRANV